MGIEAFSIFRSPPADERASRGTNPGTREVFHEQSRIFSRDHIELDAIHLYLDPFIIHGFIFGAQAEPSLFDIIEPDCAQQYAAYGQIGQNGRKKTE